MKKPKPGQRVIFTDTNCVPTKLLPVWGSKIACVGTITTVLYVTTKVKWDNGIEGTYFLSDLTLHNEGEIEPNSAFLLEKRRRR